VGTKYQTLLGNGQWEARILPSETSQKALKAEIKNEVIQELRKTEPTGGTLGGGNKDGAKNPNIICNKCKEKGHIAKNCPKKGTKQGGTKDDKDNSPNPYRVKPKDGESQIKTTNSVECSWCNCCK